MLWKSIPVEKQWQPSQTPVLWNISSGMLVTHYDLKPDTHNYVASICIYGMHVVYPNKSSFWDG